MKKRIICFVMIFSLIVTLCPLTASAASTDGYEYKTKYLEPRWIVTKGYASGQAKGGAKFSNGGGWYYSPAGGTKVKTEVRLSKTFGYATFTTTLGKVGASTGYYISAPKDKKNYYKLYVTKRVKVKPYVTYRKLKHQSNAKWKIYYKGFYYLDDDYDFKAVKVKK